MTNGAIHEISQVLGRLEAGQQAIDARIIENHADADKRWDRIEAELRTIKHDQRNLEQQNISQFDAIRRMGDKLRPLEDLPDDFADVRERLSSVERSNTQVESLTERLGVIEKMAYRVAGIAAGVSVFCSIIGAVLLRFANDLAHWLMGKP